VPWIRVLPNKPLSFACDQKHPETKRKEIENKFHCVIPVEAKEVKIMVTGRLYGFLLLILKVI